jgi:hypothetical protein
MDAYSGFEPQVGEIRAVRTFRIGPGGLLYPLFSDQSWNEGANTAYCRLPPPPDAPAHDAPDPDCSCGFYAYGSDPAASEYPHAQHVLAVVACWGRVVAGTRGIRCQNARVEAIWMGPRVPAELAAEVAAHYPATAVYAERETMLAEHAPTELDSYETTPEVEQQKTSRLVKLLIASALIIGLLPAGWLWGNQDARLVWGAEVLFFLLSALGLRFAGRTPRARGVGMLFLAVTLWLVAPFAGPVGELFLRIPIIQIVLLGSLQLWQIRREAARFPARIGRRAKPAV